MLRSYLPTAVAAGMIAIAVLGCGRGSPPAAGPAPQPTPTAESTHDEATPGDDGMKAMSEGLAELSPADRASAEQQHFCPVSGEMLGTMGTPVKVTVQGREVWLCCPSCEEPLRADPEKYLPKLNDV